ncbi:glutathione S-transferase [Protomyces lactucae-debilis]|uniref:Glutathione S-transferase n=1 Tax=Protomyces lactucae-debilis TaxID=2754530 RepID=A0A1Y2EZA7_PROLT|nr:glutathione S-transferase [Protomyces lactucae-debilis]ORY76961.1 glutathione S-transferase [Protomyces lactucae-debilis]
MATNNGYHTVCTGNAAETAENHRAADDTTEFELFGACFCPFVQRVWIQLELLDINYIYREVDPYAKPAELLVDNPKGLVPCMQHYFDNQTFRITESTVIMDYVEDVHSALYKDKTPQQKAIVRLRAYFVNNTFVPSFYRFLQATTPEGQVEHGKAFADNLGKLLSWADSEGPFFMGLQLGYLDVLVAPWLLRIRRVLKPYRDFDVSSPRYVKWIDALESHAAVAATISTDDLYLDSYKRYAENRPNTSQVANAINAGHALP